MFLESKHSDPQGHWGTDGKGIPIRGEAYQTASIQGGNGGSGLGRGGGYVFNNDGGWMGAGRRGQFVLCGCGRVESCRAAEVEPPPLISLLCRAPTGPPARDQHQQCTLFSTRQGLRYFYRVLYDLIVTSAHS